MKEITALYICSWLALTLDPPPFQRLLPIHRDARALVRFLRGHTAAHPTQRPYDLRYERQKSNHGDRMSIMVCLAWLTRALRGAST